MAKVSIQLILFNQKETVYLPFLFDSLKNQSCTDWELVLISNNAPDELIQDVEVRAKKLSQSYRVIRNDDNLGFAVGHSIGYRKTDSQYVLLLNPDMYLMPDAIERMVTFLDRHEQTAAVSTRLMRWDFAKAQDLYSGENAGPAAKAGFTSDIDAIGIRLFRNRRAVEWLTRQRWAKDSESTQVQTLFGKPAVEVFGVSGAFAMYRRSVTDKILLPDEQLFDPTYHSYKEDLDLAYRLKNAGYTSYVLLDTVAYHDRTGAGPKEMGDVAALKNKKHQNQYVQFHSYKNHFRTLYKNEYWQNVLMDLPYIVWYELKKTGFFILTNPLLIFKAWKEIVEDMSYTRRARKLIVKRRKTYWKGIRRWFLTQE